MQQNILMLYCRRIMHLSPQKAAELLGMPVSLYRDLECGDVLLDYPQARKLAKLYNSDARFFHEAAQQLDLLLSNKIIIRALIADNERLRADLEKCKRDRGPANGSFT